MSEYINEDMLELEARELPFGTSAEIVLQYSMAISLKRIADALADGSIFTQPVNQYGESFTDAIQNGIVRGQRGIDTYYGG